MYVIKARKAQGLPFRWYAFGSFVDSYLLAEPLLYHEAIAIKAYLDDQGYIDVTIVLF